jgi:hypothetical protein
MVPNPDQWITILAGSNSAATASTVQDDANMHAAKDGIKIAGLIRSRFTERYLDPALDNPKPSGKSETAFCSFFQAHEEFEDLRPVAHDFYRAIRCGILHQAEATDGWRVHRKPGLFVQNGGVCSICASEFCKGLTSVLNRYHDNLVAADWGDDIWLKARKRFQAIYRNCGLPDADVVKLAIEQAA